MGGQGLIRGGFVFELGGDRKRPRIQRLHGDPFQREGKKGS